VTYALSRLTAALADRYRVERELGAGGMATVYLAHDLRHDRLVAVKVLRPELASALGPERFLREIRIAANLTHPHILPVHDSGEADGFLFYVMPYIKGDTLRQRLQRENELPVADVVSIMRDVLDALAFAHSQGVVHRDIKPDNIMLTGRHAVVTDFGVAKAVREATDETGLTTAGVALGTPAYMAPEQATADPHVDHRADLYAVGAMAYEMLAGRTPFSGPNAQAILAAHVTESVQPVSTHRRHVSPELETVVMRCLEKKPADRFQTAEELLPYLDGMVTPSGGITPTDTRPVSAASASDLAGALKRMGSGRLVRIVGGFLVASLAMLEIVRFGTGQFGLPDWFIPVAIGLLLVGLPIILVTAFTQAGVLPYRARISGAVAPWRVPHRWFTWRRAILGGVLAFTALGSVGAGLVWLRNRNHELSDDVIAVMPFHVVGDGIDLWREGLVDLVATALDGTGHFRASNPRAVLNNWQRIVGDLGVLPEPERAADVARALGAGQMILGSVISTGPGTVRVSAELFSVRWHRKDASSVAEGSEDDMTGLVDRMSVDLLRSIWRGEDVPEVRVSSITTSSLPALRAYLEGEQAFRAGRFPDARDAYTRALEFDSTFAVAAHRLSISYGWSAGSYAEEHLRYALLAARHLDGLPARDSLLILGHKLVDMDGALDAIGMYQRVTNTYPDDFEAWYGLGEAYFHLGSQAGYTALQTVEALERAYAIDSSIAPPLIHLVQGTHRLDDSARVVNWTQRYLAIDSVSPVAQAFRLAQALRYGARDDSAWAAAAVDTANAAVLGQLGAPPLAGPSSLPLYELVGRARAGPRFSEGERASALFTLSDQYLRHGQIRRGIELDREARLVLGREGGLFTLAMLQLLELTTDSATLDLYGRLASRVPYPDQAPYLALLHIRQGRYDEANRAVLLFEHRADSLYAVGDSRRARLAQGLALAYRGHIAAEQGSADTAIELLREALSLLPATFAPFTRDLHRYLLATLIEDRGDEVEALRIYASLYWTPWLEALGHLRRAQLHERRAELDQAREHYAIFLTLWQDADAELQPRVTLAREALSRLAGEMTTE
jgi:tetratricopeptide (TPR) repeat protein